MVNNIVCDPERKSEDVGTTYIQLLTVSSKLLLCKSAVRGRNPVVDSQVGFVLGGGAARSCLFLVAVRPSCLGWKDRWNQ